MSIENKSDDMEIQGLINYFPTDNKMSIILLF